MNCIPAFVCGHLQPFSGSRSVGKVKRAGGRLAWSGRNKVRIGLNECLQALMHSSFLSRILLVADPVPARFFDCHH